MDNLFSDNENTHGQLEDLATRPVFEIKEEGWDLQNWAACHANAPHHGVPINDKDNLLLA